MSNTARERKILLVIFFSLFVIAAIILVSNIYLPEIRKLDRQIEANRIKIEELSGSVYYEKSLDEQIAILSAFINAKKERFYNEGEITTVLFADMVKEMIRKEGLYVSNFKMSSSEKDPISEFSIKGESASFIVFLEKLYKLENSVRVPYLRLAAEKDGNCTVTFRIGYEEN